MATIMFGSHSAKIKSQRLCSSPRQGGGWVSPSDEKAMAQIPCLWPLASAVMQRPLERSKMSTSGALPPRSPAATKLPHLRRATPVHGESMHLQCLSNKAAIIVGYAKTSHNLQGWKQP